MDALDDDENDIREENFWVYLILFMVYSVGGSILEHIAYFVSPKKKMINNPILTGFPIILILPGKRLPISRWVTTRAGKNQLQGRSIT